MKTPAYIPHRDQKVLMEHPEYQGGKEQRVPKARKEKKEMTVLMECL